MSGDEPGANIGGSDFCIELFDVVNDSPDANARFMLTDYANGFSSKSWQIWTRASGLISFEWTTNGSNYDGGFYFQNQPLPAGTTAKHIAICRSSGEYRLYFNGELNRTGSNSTTFFNPSQPIRIGVRGSPGSNDWFEGKIGGVRITIGEGVYTNKERGYLIPVLPT